MATGRRKTASVTRARKGRAPGFTRDPAVALLRQMPGRKLLAALNRKAPPRLDARTRKSLTVAGGSPDMGGLVQAAEVAVESAGDIGLTVSFKKVRILDVQAGFFEGNRGDVYVITSVLDGSGAQPSFKTQTFPRIKSGDALPLGTGGMLVGLVKNPRWFVDVHMMILESDGNVRAIGAAIEKARKESGLANVVKAVGALSAFDPTAITKVVTAMDAFLAILGGILAANGDDHIATVHDFYLKAQGFGVGRHPDKGVEQFQDAEVAYQIDVGDV